MRIRQLLSGSDDLMQIGCSQRSVPIADSRIRELTFHGLVRVAQASVRLLSTYRQLCRLTSMNMYLKVLHQLRYGLCFSSHSHLIKIVNDNVQIYQARDLSRKSEVR